MTPTNTSIMKRMCEILRGLPIHNFPVSNRIDYLILLPCITVITRTELVKNKQSRNPDSALGFRCPTTESTMQHSRRGNRTRASRFTRALVHRMTYVCMRDQTVAVTSIQV